MKPVAESRYARICLDMFSIRNGLKQGDTLSSLLFNFTLGYAIRKVQANQEGLNLESYRLIQDTCIQGHTNFWLC
jgi:hypothetical protein